MNLESIDDLVLTDEVHKVDIKFRTSKGRSHEKIIFCYFLLNKMKIVQTKYIVIYVMLRLACVAGGQNGRGKGERPPAVFGFVFAIPVRQWTGIDDWLQA